MSKQQPRPPKVPTSNIPLIVTVLLIIVFGFVIYLVNKPEPVTTVTSQAEMDTAQSGPLPSYEILCQSSPGNFSNFAVLVPAGLSDPDLLVMAERVKLTECATVACNVLSFWNDKAQYQQYKQQQESESWRKKHWAKLCEANVADYMASVNEFVFYPLLDSEYRKYGGTKKRPKQISYNL